MPGSLARGIFSLFIQLGHQVVPAGQLKAAALEYVRKILECAPQAIQATKHASLQNLSYASVEQAMVALQYPQQAWLRSLDLPS